jgi:hypothetical protein
MGWFSLWKKVSNFGMETKGENDLLTFSFETDQGNLLLVEQPSNISSTGTKIWETVSNIWSQIFPGKSPDKIFRISKKET